MRNVKNKSLKYRRLRAVVLRCGGVILSLPKMNIEHVTIGDLYELQVFHDFPPRTKEDIVRRGELLKKIFGETDQMKDLIDRCTKLQEENSKMGLTNYDLKRTNEKLVKANISLAAEIGELKRLVELLKTQIKDA